MTTTRLGPGPGPTTSSPQQPSDADLYDQLRAAGKTHKEAVDSVEARRAAPAASGLRRLGAGGGRAADPAAGFHDDKPASALVGAAQGATFGFADEILAGVDALQPGKTYGQSLEEVREKMNFAREANPKTALAGELVGGIAAPGVAGAATAAKAATAGGRLLRTVGAGAAVGGLAGAGNADGDLADRAKGAAVGAGAGAVTAGVLGAAIPVVAGAGRKLVDAIPGLRPATSVPVPGSAVAAMSMGGAPREGLEALQKTLFRSTEERADDKILEAMTRDNLSVPDLKTKVAERAATPKPEILPDLAGQNTRRLARAVRSSPGEGGARLDAALADRAAGAEERIVKDLLDASGAGERTNVFSTFDDLAAQRRANAKPLYEKAYQTADGAPRLIEDPEVISTLAKSERFAKAHEIGRRIAAEEGIDLPPLFKTEVIGGVETKSLVPQPVQAIDYVKRGLDDLIEGQSRAGSMARNEARVLRDKLSSMLEKVDAEVPEYKAARAQFAGDSELMEALEQGRAHFKAHPQEAERALGELSDAGKEMYRKGAMEAFLDRIESVAPGNDVSRRVAEKTLDKKRLRLLFADDASFDRFTSLLAREAQMHATRGFIGGNSQTADKIFEMADLVGVPIDVLMSGGKGQVGKVVDWAVNSGVGRAARGLHERSADAISRRLVKGTGGPQELDELVTGLEAALESRGVRRLRHGAVKVGGGATAGAAAGEKQKPGPRRIRRPGGGS